MEQGGSLMSSKQAPVVSINLKDILPENKKQAERFIRLSYTAIQTLIDTQGYNSYQLNVKLLELYTTAKGAKISQQEFASNIKNNVYSSHIDTVIFSTVPPEEATLDTMVLALLVLPPNLKDYEGVRINPTEKLPVEGMVIVHSSKVNVGDAISVLLKASTVELDPTSNSCILEIDFSTDDAFITEEHNHKLLEYSKTMVVKSSEKLNKEENKENE